MRNKFNARKIEVDGIVFDSKRESRRYQQLKALEQAGEISDLELQKPFELIPNICEPDTVGARGGVKKGKVIQRKTVYIADFVYKRDGKTIVEDAKGCRYGAAYQVFKLKKKIFFWQTGIEIQEV
jgi:hypothetical protein